MVVTAGHRVNNSNNTRVIRPASTHETHYQKVAREKISIFLSKGNIGSMVEVRFLGHTREKTSGGYEASLSLYGYRSNNGKEVIFHSFDHNSCYTKDWTEADIGKTLYAEIAGCVEVNGGNLQVHEQP